MTCTGCAPPPRRADRSILVPRQLIALSFLISWLGAYTSTQIMIHAKHTRGAALRWTWSFFASFAFGFCAIWSMHFGESSFAFAFALRPVERVYLAVRFPSSRGSREGLSGGVSTHLRMTWPERDISGCACIQRSRSSGRSWGDQGHLSVWGVALVCLYGCLERACTFGRRVPRTLSHYGWYNQPTSDCITPRTI